MKLQSCLGALAISLMSVAAAQSYNDQSTSEMKVTVSGDVVRYEPGQVIVIRGSDNKEMTYTLSPSVTVPADVQVGRRVTLYVDGGSGGSTTVTRVTTTAMPDGRTKTTTEETRRDASGATTTTTTTRIEGRVEAFAAGKSVTLVRDDGSRVTYTINSESQVPEQIAIGKTIVLVPANESEKVVKTITIRQERP